MNVVAYDNQNDLDNSRKTELTVNLTISKEYPPEFNITSETVTKFKGEYTFSFVEIYEFFYTYTYIENLIYEIYVFFKRGKFQQ